MSILTKKAKGFSYYSSNGKVRGITVRMPKDVFEKLKEEAIKSDRSISASIVRAIKQAYL